MKRRIRSLSAIGLTFFCLYAFYLFYQFYYIEKPVRKALRIIPTASIYTFEFTTDQVRLKIILPPKFISNFPELYSRLDEVIGERDLLIQFKGNPDTRLTMAWDRMMYGIQQGVTKKDFVKIYQTVDRISKQKNVEYRLSHEEDWVLIQLKHNKHFLYQVVLLDHERMEEDDMILHRLEILNIIN
ncbi:hypothetical protein SAMN05444392_101176 [Seinonella peptonophila]|uniref:Uncharacterized protein n=1 Tax=Seinonella peptonophila TaxID=112248 RepID=A0A1M4SWD9_9BACL|nr:hypothetical protein [Seinonella peptonophila]SHE36534.1 hypothetical protein SAMN05444392_101176 [Seinonella peptonophila]